MGVSRIPPLAGDCLLSARDITIEVESPAADVPAPPVADAVALDIAAHGSLAIAGESGSGKTAVIQALLGYTRPGLVARGGELWLSGERLAIADPQAFAGIRGRRISYVAQSANAMLNPIIRVGSQLLEVAGAHGMERDAARETALRLLGDVGFPAPEAIMDRYPHQLSGGQRQRVVIAMALIPQPRLLLLDEATTDLDVVTQLRILRLLRRLREHEGFGLVAVSHDLNVLRALCDQLVVMHRGRVVERGPLREVIAAPAHPYTAELVRRFTTGAAAGRRAGTRLHTPPTVTGCLYQRECPHRIARCAMDPGERRIGDRRASRCWYPEAVGPVGDDAGAVADDVTDAASPDGDAVLVVRGLRVRHREPGTFSRRTFEVLHGIDLEVDRGETLGIVGESGSGKTTLARVLCGLTPPTVGTVRFGGHDLAAPARKRPQELRRQVQIIFQNPDTALNPMQTVGEMLLRRVRLLEPRVPDARERVGELLDAVLLPRQHADRRSTRLSGGEKQRVAIARALVGDPRLVVCDEILSSLDVLTQAEILGLIRDLQAERGLSLLFISHDIALTMQLAHRVAVFKDGDVVEYGPARRMLARPQQEYTRSLLEGALVSVHG
jgi:peptide/nickel transport system ATP-binding protein